MNDRPSLSVCLAMYNGREFILQQLESILREIGRDDEVLIIDDKSKDDSVVLVQSIDDKRIKLVVNERNLGPNGSFERALNLAANDVIFLADQDDIWPVGRVEVMLAALEKMDAYVVSGGSAYIDREGKPIFVDDIPTIEKNTSTKYLGNILKIFRGNVGYFGCAMALRKSFVKTIVPFPAYTESHDLWIAMAGNLAGRNVHVDDTVLYRRIHGFNFSYVKRSIFAKLYSRLVFCLSMLVLTARIYLYKSARQV